MPNIILPQVEVLENITNETTVLIEKDSHVRRFLSSDLKTYMIKELQDQMFVCLTQEEYNSKLASGDIKPTTPYLIIDKNIDGE